MDSSSGRTDATPMMTVDVRSVPSPSVVPNLVAVHQDLPYGPTVCEQ